MIDTVSSQARLTLMTVAVTAGARGTRTIAMITMNTHGRRPRGARAPGAEPADLCRTGRRRRRRRHRVERHQHRHRAAALDGPDAAISPAWAIRWCRATSRSAASSPPAPPRIAQSASACSCRARAASATCAACSAAPRPRLVVPGARAMPIDETLGERGVLLALAATAHHAPAGGAAAARPDRRPRRARPAARALPLRPALHRRRSGNAIRQRRRAPRLPRRRSRRRHAPRLSRASATSAATRSLLDTLIAPPRAAAARSCSPASTATAVLRLSAGLHARGADARRRRVAPPTSPPSGDWSIAAACRSTVSSRIARSAAMRRAPIAPHSAIPLSQDGPRLESHAA